jgi:hypothetical protein
MFPISSGCKWLMQFEGGGVNITVIFFRAMVSLGCAAHWSMKGNIFCCLPPLMFKLHKKLLKSGWSHPLIVICCVFGGKFFYISEALGFAQSPVEVISHYHQCCNLAEQWPYFLFCFTMARITFVYQCLTGREIVEECSFININIKYALWLVSVNYFEQLFAFLVHHCFRIYNGTFLWHSLIYQVVSFLKTVNPAVWSQTTVDG